MNTLFHLLKNIHDIISIISNAKNQDVSCNCSIGFKNEINKCNTSGHNFCRYPLIVDYDQLRLNISYVD